MKAKDADVNTVHCVTDFTALLKLLFVVG